MPRDYVHVTEVAGDRVSREQMDRILSRYAFARGYCAGKDVFEVACGSGQGLGCLGSVAGRIFGGDFSSPLLKRAQDHYGGSIPLVRLDAQELPLRDQALDVVVLFEAIYYLEDPDRFVKECLRVLRPGGVVLLCNANKDLPDFNPSPYSHRYFSPAEFAMLLSLWGFEVRCFAGCEVNYSNWKQRVLAIVKKGMVRIGVMPRTMEGKKLLKRIIFGKLVTMPSELSVSKDIGCPEAPGPIGISRPEMRHKVIFAAGMKRGMPCD